MTQLSDLVGDGFCLPREGRSLEGLALFSLRIAMKAYFSTYRSMRGSLHMFDSEDEETRQSIDANHSSSYCEAYAEAIVHFQHFAELACKDFLRKEHQLLALDASSRPVILHKLLMAEEVDQAQLEGLKSIEFSTTVERLCKLIKRNCMRDRGIYFVKDHEDALTKLNSLRNRVWHRGRFILRYPALDEFVGRFVLPFVFPVVLLPGYANFADVWKYEELACGIDPIDQIRANFQTGQYDLYKVALLKELGRAAYANPIRNHPIFSRENDEYRSHAIRQAHVEMSNYALNTSQECPVCGTESLVIKA
jgi:hypothetical protein